MVVSAYVHQNIPCKLLEFCDHTEFESIWISMRTHSLPHKVMFCFEFARSYAMSVDFIHNDVLLRCYQDSLRIFLHVFYYDSHKACCTHLQSRRLYYSVFSCCLLVLLQSFVHVSTAYSNCDKDVLEEKFYPPSVDVKNVLEIAK